MAIKKRFLFSGIMEKAHADNRAIIITGPRQSGKTTLLKQVSDELKKSGQETYFFNLEDRDYLTAFDDTPKNLLKSIPKDRKVFVFVDEIQYLKDPSNFLKYLYDEYSETIKLIVSGSSAFYIDEKFDDSLSGRKWLLALYPMGFKEYLYFRDEDLYRRCVIDTVDIFQPAVRREIETLFEDYILYGGFPAAVTCPDNNLRKEILNDIIHSFLKKDIRDSGIKDEERFYNVLKLLAARVGNLVNKNEICKTVGLSQSAVEGYLYMLKKTFYISLIGPFFTNISKEICKMPKVFFFDNGIRNILLKNFTPLEVRPDKGSMLENTVFRYFTDTRNLGDIKFWRKKAGAEIDFVIDDNAYEVKYSTGTIKTQQLQSFKTSHPGIGLSVLFYRGEESAAGISHRYIPGFLLK
jgi:predicted AAA+ superfamily ATPase